MSDDQSALSAINNGFRIYDLASKLGGGMSLGTGGYLPGAMAAYQGPGMGAAVSAIPTMATMMPFLGLAGFNIANLIAGQLEDKPSVTFSGLEPKYGSSDGRYTWTEQGYDKKQSVSDKYNYYLTVQDTDNDPEIAKQLIQMFDSMFDNLAAQGVPVNDMLERNKEFLFGRSMTDLDGLMKDITTHFQPDIEAYQSGQAPPERTISAEPVGPRSDGLPGSTVFDATNAGNYGPTGADGYMPSIPATGRDADTNNILYGRGGEDMQQEILPKGAMNINIPGGTATQPSGGNTMPTNQSYPGVFVPSDIPGSLQPGYQNFVEGSNQANTQYQAQADDLWNDYLAFENRYLSQLAGMPQVNLQMPDTMGGGTVPLAPKVHSAMYTDQYNTLNRGVNQRDALAQNMFTANLQHLQNAFMPTQAGMDLYQMERAGQMGLDRVNAGRYEPDALSTWAPVVGELLQSEKIGSAMDGLWGVGKGLWDTGSGLVKSVWDSIF